jgi:molecular chaperone GrpE
MSESEQLNDKPESVSTETAAQDAAKESNNENDTVTTDSNASSSDDKRTNENIDDKSNDKSAAEISKLKQQRDAAQLKATENEDKFLRLQAEMDNLRKRSAKQVEDAHKYSSQKIIEALLPVVDSLEMGMSAEGDLDSIREGMGLTMKQFEGVMEKFNIVAVDPKGEVFDPNLHQAMSMQPCPDQENNTISMVMQKGYTLHGRLIRPAMVMVCKNS